MEILITNHNQQVFITGSSNRGPLAAKRSQHQLTASFVAAATATATATLHNSSNDDDDDNDEVAALSRRFEAVLRRSKANLPGCAEILLPQALSRRVAADVHRLADSEPYGLRGCTIYVNFEPAAAAAETAPSDCPPHIRLSTVDCDVTTPDTFELYLTLREAAPPTWNQYLPHFVKKITKGGTIVISSDYALRKRKLYRNCYDE